MTQENKAESVSGQLGVIRDDLAKLARMVGDAAAEKAHQANAAASEFAETANDRAEPYVARAEETFDKAKATIRRNPALALTIAAGAGLLAARAVFSRR